MNKPLLNALCVSLLAGTSSSFGRADDGSASIAPKTMMAVTVAPSAGAVVIEASTNLVDWTDVTMLFPSDAGGLFLDTESTNYNYRFYRMRSTVSAANNLVTVNSLADLRTLSAISGNADVAVRGYYATGDGGGGQFYWDANSTDIEDGGITIVPSSSPPSGRWKRNVQSEVNVKWFGAIGNGLVNDKRMIQAALDYVDHDGGGKVFLPRGRYFLGADAQSTLKVGDNTLLEGAGASSVLVSKGPQALRNKKSQDFYDYGNTNITIQNLTIDCAKQGIMGIVFNSVEDGTIHNVRILDPQGYGIWLFRLGDSALGEGKPTRRVVVSNCHLSGVVDTGIECSGAVGCTVVGNTVTGTGGIAGYLAWNGSTDCVFSANVAEGEGATNSFVGFAVYPCESPDLNPALVPTSTQRISFIGNIARNVKRGVFIKGDSQSKPRNILIKGNSLFGLGASDRGFEVEQATLITFQGNTVSGFQVPMIMNDASAWYPLQGATRVFLDNNTVEGGDGCLLYGNTGGSLNGNRFLGQRFHSVSLMAWKSCHVNDNTFANLGVDQNTVGIVVLSHAGIGATGNTFSGNNCLDDRDTKWTSGTVVFSVGPHDSNIVTKNSAFGATPGAKAFLNYGSGTNNIVVNNIDG